MVRTKAVPSLRQLCIKVLPKFIFNHIKNMSHKANAIKWYRIFEGNVNVDRDLLIKQQITETKRYIYQNVIWYDHEEVFRAMLKGVEETVFWTRQKWKPSSDMAQYRQEMDDMSAFSDIVIFPFLKRLNFSFVPNVLRSRIIAKIDQFAQLRVLIISSGCGGQWMFRSVAKTMAKGMQGMKYLAHFSCKHDCSYELIEVLSINCFYTLRTLDVENSKGIDDKCFVPIANCTNLEQLNIFNTKLSDEKIARLLVSLPKLTRLEKGDFLCDALGWIDYWDEVPDLKLLITEFFPSQKYFFHEEWQMEMVSRMCPYVSKVFFLFHETCVESYLFLANFEYLTELCVYGGSFYRDKLSEFIQIKGVNLTRVTFMAITDIDYLAISNISIYCPNIISLGLINCEFSDYRPQADPNSDSEYERRQNFTEMVKKAHDSIKTFQNLEDITIQSTCKAVYLVFLLGKCPHLKTIYLGKATEISDITLMKIFSIHGLTKLEQFHCEFSSGLSLKSLTHLVNNCDNLQAVSDIQNWSKVTPAQVGQFRQGCHEQNWDLDTRSHQKLRKYLEMRDSERKSYVNFLAGPTMEKLRLAQQAREN